MLLQVGLHILTTAILNFCSHCPFLRPRPRPRPRCRWRFGNGRLDHVTNIATGSEVERQTTTAEMHSVRRLLQVSRSCRVAHSSIQRRAFGSRCTPRVWSVNSAASRLSGSVNGSSSCSSQWSGGWACNGTTPLVSFFRGYAGVRILLLCKSEIYVIYPKSLNYYGSNTHTQTFLSTRRFVCRLSLPR